MSQFVGMPVGPPIFGRMTDADHSRFMRRAMDLARLGEGRISPNPMVGAVLVAQGRIIGEGYHHRYGESHAEVRAIGSVKEEDRPLLTDSTLYVTLEPCCVYGRTPPCTDLILKCGIPRVVVSVQDQSPGIQGRGIRLLEKQGVHVQTGIMALEGSWLAMPRNVFVSENRPFIWLKYAMSKDGMIGQATHQVNLSNPVSWRLVHRLRQKADAIMVGTDTVLVDNPRLTNRLFWGREPVRIIPDLNARLPVDARIFHLQGETWIFRSQSAHHEADLPANVRVLRIDADRPTIPQMLSVLAGEGITGLMVEGGGRLLRAFLAAGLWDEAIVSSCPSFLGEGIPNPGLLTLPEDSWQIGEDQLYWFRHPRYHVDIR